MFSINLFWKIILFTLIVNISFANDRLQEINGLEKELVSAKGEKRAEILNTLVNKYSFFDSIKSFNYFKESLLLCEEENYDFNENNVYIGLTNYLDICKEYNKAISLLEKALKFAVDNKCNKAIGYAYSKIGHFYLKMNNYSEAVKYQNIALNKFLEINYNYGIATAYERLGVIYMIKNDFTEALRNYYLALKINQKSGFQREAAVSLYHIGLTELYLSNYNEAVNYILKSLKYWEKIEYAPNIWNCNELIGNIFIKLKDYEQALNYHRIALEIRKNTIYKTIKLGKGSGDDIDTVNNLGMAYSFNNIAEVFLNQGQYDSAYYYASKSLKMKEWENSIASLNDIANSQLNFGNILCCLNKYDSAVYLLKKAAETYKNIENKTSFSETQYGLGKVFLKLKDYHKAKSYFLDGLNIAKEINDKNNLKIGYKLLSELFAKNKNYKKSLEYHILYTEIKDSVLNKTNLSKIEELQIIYEIEKKEHKIKQQNVLIKHKQYKYKLTLIIGSFLLLIASIIIFFIINSRKQKEKLLQKEKENLKKELELNNRDLVFNVSKIYTKNQVINKVAQTLTKNNIYFKQANVGIVNDIISELRNNIDETSWKEFESYFAKVHGSFYKSLDEHFPGLSKTERKICAMLKLGMSSKEIAAITVTSHKSIDTTRYRLRKKLGLTHNENLFEFLNKL
ncbi:MAG: LuxR family transcriptional regulator [Bacteroidales bacterium]|nr:LuxR family transcriptional regulator [Bacteroidales bacterium]